MQTATAVISLYNQKKIAHWRKTQVTKNLQLSESE